MKSNISNELITRFHCGDVSAEEFKEVLLAAEQDPDLKEEIAIMSSLADDRTRNSEEFSARSNIRIIAKTLRREQMAARRRYTFI